MSKFWLKLIRSISSLIRALPISVQFFLGDLIGYLWFDILRIRRKTALNNLLMCFPNWTDEMRLQVARRSVCHIGRCFIEFLRIPSTSKQRDGKLFKIVGEEHLEKAQSRGRGVFLLTAHIGNGDWATVGLALHGFHLNVISKRMTIKWFNEFWFETRKALGTEFIPDRGSSLTILKKLKQRGVVVFLLDQFMGPPIGVKTTFFGRETGTAMGLAVLAGRSRAPVVPICTYRDENGLTYIQFEPEIVFEESDNKEDTIKNMTQKYCDKIESWVRQYPEQWMWVHRRWKKFKH